MASPYSHLQNRGICSDMKSPADKISIIQSALNQLIDIRKEGESFHVHLPISYPGGDGTVVSVQIQKDLCRVGDLGLGHKDAFLSDAESSYLKLAKQASTSKGLRFSDHEISSHWSPLTHLPALMVNVATLSSLTSYEAMRSTEERQVENFNEEIFHRISEIFGSQSVKKNADMRGAHASWKAHNVVLLESGHRAVFEYMSPHASSYTTKFAMFSDIRKVGNIVSLNAMVPRISDLDEKAQIVGDVANILEITASMEAIRASAFAA